MFQLKKTPSFNTTSTYTIIKKQYNFSNVFQVHAHILLKHQAIENTTVV